jgi:hypothetical protein
MDPWDELIIDLTKVTLKPEDLGKPLIEPPTTPLQIEPKRSH